MQCSYDQDNEWDDEINAAVDRILAEDREETRISNKSEHAVCNHPTSTAQETEERDCKEECFASGRRGRRKLYLGVRRSKRFSLRVMEAMREIGRQGGGCHPGTSSPEEIVECINRHFPGDGDVDAQVRTCLMRLSAHGFVAREDDGTYRLLGPMASNLLRTEAPPPGRKRRKDAKPPGRCQEDAGVDLSYSDETTDDDLSFNSSVDEGRRLRRDVRRDIVRIQGTRDHSNRARRRRDTPRRDGRCSSPVARTPRRTPRRGRRTSTPIVRVSRHTPRTKSRSRTRSPARRPRSPPRRRQLDEADVLSSFEVGAHMPEFEDSSEEARTRASEAPESLGASSEEPEPRGRCRAASPGHEPEVKRWLRSCRRECARRARGQRPD